MQYKRIVVTGMGAVSPIGNSVEETWENAKAGKSGIDYLKNVDVSKINARIGGEVKDFDAVGIFGARDARRMDRLQQLALYAARQAWEDSGLVLTPDNQYDIGCLVGSGIGGISTLTEMIRAFMERGQKGVSPLAIPEILSDGVGARISIDLGLRGPSYNIASACATGNHAIGDAADMIRLGRAEAMLVGGGEAALIDVVLAGFQNMKALTQWDGEPSKASRPFDAKRSGFVAAEGSAVLVIESLEHAQARGAHIYAEIKGYGHTSDAYHVTAPLEDGAGAVKAMTLALKDANMEAESIQYFNAHGTSTTFNDRSETRAIKTIFGERAYDLPISSTKSMTGHLLGAAGAIEAMFSILAIRDNFAPPTINLEFPDPECDLDYIPNCGREVPIDHVMSYSAGFGGHNAVLVFSRFVA
ncbi:MAG: beta-ketoacyl-ACP synthase II [Chloroflexota bacterium]